VNVRAEVKVTGKRGGKNAQMCRRKRYDEKVEK